MSTPHRKFAFFAASALAATTALGADLPPQTQPDLNAKLEALQAEINQIKQQQAAQATQQQEMRTTHDLLEDADRHSQFLDAQGVLAGWTSGRFVLQSEDGQYLAHPWLQVQFRNVTSYRQDAKQNGAEDDLENGFEMRRLKFGVDGNLFGRQLTYFTQFAVDRKSGNVQLEQAYAKYQIDDTPFGIRAGQFKDPLDHEQLTASKIYPAIDRTYIDDQFANAEGFVKGVSFIYDPARAVRTEVAFTGGLRNYNTSFQPYPTNVADWGAVGRVEYKAFGSWKDYEQMSAYGVAKDTLVFGGGADYTEIGHSAALVHVVDAQYQTGRGVSIYAAYLGRYTRGNLAAKEDTYDASARGQIAWAIDQHWEPYGRYEYIHFNGKEFAAGTQSNVQVITAGVNYYLYGQSFRISADVSYLPEGAPISDDGLGILAENGHTELVGRVQFQLLL